LKFNNIRREFFSQSLIPKKGYKGIRKACILGFDTEYDSHTQELVSWQLSYKGYKRIFTDLLSWELLYDRVIETVRAIDGGASRRKYRAYVLATYFSIAEAQHLDVFGIGVRIDEWGNGNYDFTKSFPDKQQTIRICDVQQWFRGMALRFVAKTFGLEKLDYDVTNVTKECLQDPLFIEYALHDAHITEVILNKLRYIFLESYQIDILSSRTPANTAAIIFLKDYLTETIEQHNTQLRRLVLLCSWGGNNQCFVRGHKSGRFSLYDAVSMYPNSCIQLKKLPREQDWKRGESIRDMLRPGNIGGVCKVKFQFPDTERYPCLPVWSDKLRGLCYPLTGISCCTLQELRLASKRGAKLVLRIGFYYTDGVDYLQRFMYKMLSHKLDAKAKGDKPSEAMFKLMVNSIVGKFTQKTIKVDINDLLDYSRQQGIPVEFLVNIKNFPRLSKKVNLGNIFYPEWNCLILGYARATLAEAFIKYNALVGTTDSLITEERLPKTVTINNIPFELKTQGNHLLAVRTRVYCLWNQERIEYIAHHGIHNRDKAVDIMRQLDKQDTTTYTRKHIVKIRESMRSDRKLGEVVIKDDMRFNLTWDNKRERGSFYTSPLIRIPDTMLSRGIVT